LEEYVQKLLEELGISVAQATTQAVATSISLVATVLLALVAFGVARFLLLRVLARSFARSGSKGGAILLQTKVLHRLALLAPAVAMYFLIPFTLAGSERATRLVNQVVGTFVIIVIFPIINASLSAAHAYYETLEVSKTFPITSTIQVFKIAAFGLVGIVAVSFFFGIPAVFVLAALGALAATGTVVFNELVLAFVSGMLLTAKRLIAIGDRIAMPDLHVDGQVREITLTTVLVENWDKTFAAVPSKYLLTRSFKNWRGIEAAGTRRIMRPVYIDMHSIQLCTEEMLDTFSSIPYVDGYVRRKRGTLAERDAGSQSINAGTTITNLGVFRAYVTAYLGNHPQIISDMPLCVYQEAPTAYGLPVQVLAFCGETEETAYQVLQSDIFDHILTMVPKFELRIYQSLERTSSLLI
jgi:miniconductance mechanosensitive channel